MISLMLNSMTKPGQDYSQEISWLLKEKYQGVMSEAAETDIERVKQGEPVAYVIGFVDFLGCKIDLSQRPLIPRVETEFWVEKVIEELNKNRLEKIKCLDMFAGSGCIGVAVLKNVLLTTIDFVDQDDKAITQIEINCKINDINPSRLRIIKSDIFEHISGSYDYIFANPPYIAESRKDEVQGSVISHEPHIALFGGENGLIYIETFLDKAMEHLNKNGQIYMEFDEHQKDEIEKILEGKGFREISFYRDQFEKWRFLHISL